MELIEWCERAIKNGIMPLLSHIDTPTILLSDHSLLKTIQKHAMQKQNGAHLFWVDYNDTVRSKRWIEWKNTQDTL